MIENTDGPDACGPLGHWVIEKDAFDHLGTIAVKPVYVVIVPKTLAKEVLVKRVVNSQYSTVNSK